MKKLSDVRLLFFVTLLISLFSCSVQEADIVLKNGDIYTVEEDQLWVKAVVITNNEITAVFNDDSKANKYIGKNTRVIDLKNKLLSRYSAILG